MQKKEKKEPIPHQQLSTYATGTGRYSFPRPYPMEWACLVGGAFLAFYYSWVMDDAYVYFRYVDNLVYLNNGLVYNRGEYVEGFSSPAWAIFLTILRTLHLNYWFIIRLTAVLSYVVFWVLLIIANRRLSEGIPKPSIINFPLIYLSFTYGVLSSFSSGMETPLIQVSAAAFACLLLFPRSSVLQMMVGISPLIRHELLVPYAIVFAWLLISTKKIPWILFLACVISLGGWVFFRVYYYADVLPNTFYLKDMVFLKQGIYYLYDTILPYFTVPTMLAFLVGFIFLMQRQGSSRLSAGQRGMMLVLAVSSVIYVVKIGGDFVHFRYLAFAYCIVIISTGGIVERLLDGSKIQPHGRFIVPLALIVAAATFICYPRQLLQHPIFRHVGFRHGQFLNIEDAASHRMNRQWTPGLFSTGSGIELRHEMQKFARSGNVMSPDSVMYTARCENAYRMFNYYVIHSLGLTDPFLARTIAPLNRPGHKDTLVHLARDIAEIRKRSGFRIGAFDNAVENADGAPWVEDNLATIKTIELKAYNDHDIWKNLRLAWQRTGRIRP